MRVLVSDNLDSAGIELLRNEPGFHVNVITGLSPQELKETISDYDALIHNIDRPGSIREIGTMLGNHNINIGRMQVGQEEEGNRNLIFLDTDIPIPPSVFEKIQNLPTVKSVTLLDL